MKVRDNVIDRKDSIWFVDLCSFFPHHAFYQRCKVSSVRWFTHDNENALFFEKIVWGLYRWFMCESARVDFPQTLSYESVAEHQQWRIFTPALRKWGYQLPAIDYCATCPYLFYYISFVVISIDYALLFVVKKITTGLEMQKKWIGSSVHVQWLIYKGTVPFCTIVHVKIHGDYLPGT